MYASLLDHCHHHLHNHDHHHHHHERHNDANQSYCSQGVTDLGQGPEKNIFSTPSFKDCDCEQQFGLKIRIVLHSHLAHAHAYAHAHDANQNYCSQPLSSPASPTRWATEQRAATRQRDSKPASSDMIKVITAK